MMKRRKTGVGKSIGIGAGIGAATHGLHAPVEWIADGGIKDLKEKEFWKGISKDRFASKNGLAGLGLHVGAGALTGYLANKAARKKNKED